MGSPTSPTPPILKALRAIERAIGGLSHPISREMLADPFVSQTVVGYDTSPGPERDSVREDLIGAAFALAQVWIQELGVKKAMVHRQPAVNHVANYWKHRDEWAHGTPPHSATAQHVQTSLDALRCRFSPAT